MTQDQIEAASQFLPDASLRLVDATVHARILADYPSVASNGGILFGVSPQTLRDTYGVNWVDNPVTSDYSNLTPIGCVFTVSNNATSQVLGHSVSGAADGVQTLSGVSYTDPNGQTFTSVTWAWQVEVVMFTVGSSQQDTYDQQVINYTGDGTSNRLIATSFDLTTKPVSVFIFPQVTNSPSFRHSGMPGTALSAFPPTATGGIMAFQAGGFTVTDDTISLCRVNTNLAKYTAVVIRASTKYMGLKTYTGLGTISTSGTFTTGSNTATVISGAITSNDVGRTITIGGSQVVTIVSMVGITLTISANSLLNGSQTITSLGGGQTVQFVGAGAAPTMALVFGRSGQAAFYTKDMPAGQSTSLGVEAQPTTNQITGAAYDSVNGIASINVGANSNVNNVGLTMYAVCFSLPTGDPAAAALHTFKVTGTGSNIAATGFGFSPAVATMRVFDATLTNSIYRTGQFTSDAAVKFNGTGVNGINSIDSMDADGCTIGSNVVTSGLDGYGFAVPAATQSVTSFSPPSYPEPTGVTNPDGTPTIIENPTPSQPQIPGNPPSTGTPRWWCNPHFGYALYQIDSPGDGWVACSGPTSANGWYLSPQKFENQDIIVSGGMPADPRPWSALANWATGNAGPFGGFPGSAGVFKNTLIYAASGYTVATDAPPIRSFNGRSDRELCRVPATTGGATPRAVMSFLVANGTVYFTSWDSGTSSSTFTGRVFQLDPATGQLTVLGAATTAGEMPYALAWHMGRLWLGTNNGIGTVGKVYWFRPGIDTTWTQDHATSSDSAGGVLSMVSYRGNLMVGTDNASGSRGKVLQRTPAAVWSTSQTGSGGSAVVNNGYLSMVVFGANLYASYWNKDTTAVSRIEKFDGSTWSLVFLGAGGNLKPFIQLAVDEGVLFGFGGSVGYPACVIRTNDGASWVDQSATLPETTGTFLPNFGVVVG